MKIIIGTIIFKKNNNIYIMSDKYVYVTSSWAQCFKMKIKLPKHFHNVSKKNEEYKKWKKSEDDKFDNTITLMDDECWWNNFEEKKKKELIKDYGTCFILQSKIKYLDIKIKDFYMYERIPFF